MSTAAHTPGPWHRDQYGTLLDANGRNVLFRGVAIAASGSMVAKAEANTDLISAAPELLEALIEIEEQYRLLLGESFASQHQFAVEHSPTIKQARAAIAKATGSAA